MPSLQGLEGKVKEVRIYFNFLQGFIGKCICRRQQIQLWVLNINNTFRLILFPSFLFNFFCIFGMSIRTLQCSKPPALPCFATRLNTRSQKVQLPTTNLWFLSTRTKPPGKSLFLLDQSQPQQERSPTPSLDSESSTNLELQPSERPVTPTTNLDFDFPVLDYTPSSQFNPIHTTRLSPAPSLRDRVEPPLCLLSRAWLFLH